jgi:eukaryotic-like serine/threonine-protein kinase
VRGNLNLTKLPAILRAFFAERKSGILHFSCRPSPRRVFFQKGRIVRVESDAESDRFGEELVESGRVQRAELNLALQLATREGTSVGAALVKMNRLTTEELKEGEVRRMSEIVHSLIALTAGEFRFEEAENPVTEEDAFEISAGQVILDGVRRITDADLLRTLVGDLRATLRTTPSSALPLFQIKMTPGERSLLQATGVRQTFSTEQLLSGSRLSEIETLRAVYALISIGLLEVDGTTQAPGLDRIEGSELAADVASEPAAKAEARVGAAPQVESIRERLGRFEIQRLLERSSTGEVFRGRDPDIDRIVAIKVLASTGAPTPAVLEKYLESFHQELDRARQLHHPGIVAILEKGLTEDGRPFLVTEYVKGTTLRDLLPSGPLAMKHALELAAQILDALAYAHSRGIVHRRVKPSNVLVTADGRVKVKDFGLPRLPDADVSGSLPYFSPEQIASGRIDARSDVFSFGVVFYRMLTGALPFPEDSFTTVVRALRPLDPPAPLERYGSEFPSRLGKIVLRCLAGDPRERFADAGELKQAMSCLEEPTSAAEKAVPAPGPAPSVPAIAPSLPPAHATTRPSVPPPAAAEPRTPPKPASPPPKTRTPRPSETPIVVPVVEAAPRVEPEAVSANAEQVASDGAAEAPSAPASVAAKGAPALRARRTESRRRSPEPAEPAPRGRTGRWIWAVPAVACSVAAVGAGAVWILVAREEPPWKELPSAPAGDVSVTPIPLSPPSEAELAALLAGPSDEALFADASSALKRGDLRESRSILMELLERDPEFPGARALLERVEAERRKAADRRRPAVEVQPEPPSVAATDPSDAELFAEAENALARGELAVSKTKLDALLKINPGFSGAAELMERIEHRIWTTTLPRSFAARHNHRIGGCDGVLSLTYTGLSFRSNDHEWAWAYDKLIGLDRPDAVNFYVVTSDRDLLGILSNKRFTFRLEEVFSDDDWRFFRKTVLDRDLTPGPRN